MELKELTPFSYRIVEKENKPGIRLTVGGIFQRADMKNANGRVYPRDLWQKVLTREDVVDRVQQRQMLGMFGHPASGQTDPMSISHIVTRQELKPDGTIYGEAEVLDTPAGRVVETLFRAGVKLGISSRGDGSVEKSGGAEQVQDDFRLETYDFVLKPSTPGAYPGMVESVEEGQKNEKMVADAIAGLVKSDMPTDKRLPVLTQCLKILSVLESKDVVDQVKSVTRAITEELQGSKPLVVLEARDNARRPRPTQEVTMNPNRRPPVANQSFAPQLDQSTLQWVREQINTAVRQVAGKKNEEIRAIKNSLIKAQQEASGTRKRLTAAEEIIDEMQTKFKRAQKRDVAPQYESLKRRYNASVDLLEAALERLPEIGQLNRRSGALESLLNAAVDKYRSEGMKGIKESYVERLPQQLQESAKVAFRHCRTPEEVAETFKALMGATGRNSEPLPARGRKLSESTNKNAARQDNEPVDFTSRLASRLNMAV